MSCFDADVYNHHPRKELQHVHSYPKIPRQQTCRNQELYKVKPCGGPIILASDYSNVVPFRAPPGNFFIWYMERYLDSDRIDTLASEKEFGARVFFSKELWMQHASTLTL